jgi:hypothetical protein
MGINMPFSVSAEWKNIRQKYGKIPRVLPEAFRHIPRNAQGALLLV